jgi:hypothetical protein
MLQHVTGAVPGGAPGVQLTVAMLLLRSRPLRVYTKVVLVVKQLLKLSQVACVAQQPAVEGALHHKQCDVGISAQGGGSGGPGQVKKVVACIEAASALLVSGDVAAACSSSHLQVLGMHCPLPPGHTR